MKTILALIFSFPLLHTATAQYPGYGRYQRKIEEQKKIEQQQALEKFYDNLPLDTVVIFDAANVNGNKESQYGIALKHVTGVKIPTIGKAYKLKYTTVYFTGYGFPVPYVQSLANGSTIDSSMQNKFGIGTTFIFDTTTLEDASGREFKIPPITYVVRSNDLKRDSSVNYPRKELFETAQYPFSSGMIYFAKAGFPVAQSIAAREIGTEKGRKLMERTRPGSEVVFDNCRYFDKEKKVAVTINKTFHL